MFEEVQQCPINTLVLDPLSDSIVLLFLEKSPRVCETAMLLASICSTMERLPITTTAPSVSEDSALLQAYLTERAMQDSRIKQQQYKPKVREQACLQMSVELGICSLTFFISPQFHNKIWALLLKVSDGHKYYLPDIDLTTKSHPNLNWLDAENYPTLNTTNNYFRLVKNYFRNS